MRYLEFNIEKYKAISSLIKINVNSGVYPIIGLNESGKTTILQAICAFDYHNDNLYPEHLDCENLLSDVKTGIIGAKIEIRCDLLRTFIKECKTEEENTVWDYINATIGSDKDSIEITITRKINGKKIYNLTLPANMQEQTFTEDTKNSISLKIIDAMPSILYFDDFRDSHKGSMTIQRIKDEEPNLKTEYQGLDSVDLQVMEVLFEEAYKNNESDAKVKIADLFEMPSNKIKTTESKINNTLQKIINEKWSMMQSIEPMQEPKIAITITDKGENKIKGKTIKEIKFELQVKETKEEEEKFFPITKRSKGFQWFFIFIYKTYLTPKRLQNQNNNGIIFLLDEPGCYLQASAQQGLCEVFKELTNQKNVVIYNTHSHYLLDKDFLPNVKIAYKDNNSSIFLTHFAEYKFQKTKSDEGKKKSSSNALEPIRRALNIQESILNSDIIKKNIIIFEGILEYYLWSDFIPIEDRKDIGIIPSTGANNTINQLLIILSVEDIKVKVMLDDDKQGKDVIEKYKDNYINYFTTYGNDYELENFLDKEEFKELSKDFINNIDNIDYKYCIPILHKKYGNELKNKMPKTANKMRSFWNDKIKSLYL